MSSRKRSDISFRNLAKRSALCAALLLAGNTQAMAEDLYRYTVNGASCTLEIAAKNVNWEADHPGQIIDPKCPAQVIQTFSPPPQLGLPAMPPLYGPTDEIVLQTGSQPILLNAPINFGPLVKVRILGGNRYASEANSNSIISGQNKTPLFRIGGDALVVWSGVILQNGYNAAGAGGVLIVEGEEARVYVEDSVLRNGAAVSGGLIYNEGNLTIQRSILTRGRALLPDGSNGANNRGGALLNRGVATLLGDGHPILQPPFDPLPYDDTSYSDPRRYTQVKDSASVQGGGIYNSGALVMRNINLVDNFAGSLQPANEYSLPLAAGGQVYNALYFHGSVLRFFGGKSIGPGSGIYNAYGDLVLFRSSFVDHVALPNKASGAFAQQGGVVTNVSGKIELTRSSFAQNQSCEVAAMKLADNAAGSRVSNNTFADNDSTCDRVVSVTDPLHPDSKQPVGPVQVAFEDDPAIGFGACTVEITGNAKDFRLLHNTFLANDMALGELCIRKFSAEYYDPSHNNPPASGL